MGLFNTGNQFPYTNFHDMNLDWIIKKMKELIAEWAQMRTDWAAYQENLNGQWSDYKDDLNGQWEDYKNLVDSDIAEYKRDLNSQWTDYKNDLNLDWSQYQSALNADWNQYKTDLNNAWALFKAGIEARQDAVEAGFRDLKKFVEDYFDNVDWAQLLEDLMTKWYNNGTLIRLIAPYLPFLTPEMYGAVADGVADDSAAWNQMMADAVSAAKAMWISPRRTYRLASQVNIPGTISLVGNGAKLLVDDGVNGLVCTAAADESTIENLTINSAGTEWPELPSITNLSDLVSDQSYDTWVAEASKGLVLSGEHIKVRLININNFGLGLYFDETIKGNVNQTGCIFNNNHIRYCGVAARLGSRTRNGRTTDYTVTDSTFAGRYCGLYISDAIGYFVNNIHTWGSKGVDGSSMMLVGINALNCSLTDFERIYIEPCQEYAMRIHSRKGLNIDNFTYVSTFSQRPNDAVPVVFFFDGSPNYQYHVNLDNISIRTQTPVIDTSGDTPVITHPYVKPLLIRQGNGGIFNIGNVSCSENIPKIVDGAVVWHASILEGEAYDLTNQSYGFFYQNNQIMQFRRRTPYNMQIAGKTVLSGPVQTYLPYNATELQSGIIEIDMSDNKIEIAYPVAIKLFVTTRNQAGGTYAGEYLIGAMKRGEAGHVGEIEISSVQPIVNNSRVAITLDNSQINKLIINIAGLELADVTYAVAEVQYAYFLPNQVPENLAYSS